MVYFSVSVFRPDSFSLKNTLFMTKKYLLKRDSDSNKGDFGHVLIAGGDCGMGGAVIMAAEVSCRSGAGKVTVLTHQEHFSPLLSRLPNAMTTSLEKVGKEAFANKSVIAIGCGMGKEKWGRDLFEMAMEVDAPKIIDADALNILSENKKSYDLSNSIITPHVGEAARLLGVTTQEIQRDRKLSAQQLHEKFGAIVVLKGQGTLVLGKNIHQCLHGNPGMATAGMGDVLTGIIAALVAQNLNLEDAAILGVDVHALAGDMAKEEIGEIGLMPMDLFKYIPKILSK